MISLSALSIKISEVTAIAVYTKYIMIAHGILTKQIAGASGVELTIILQVSKVSILLQVSMISIPCR